MIDLLKVDEGNRHQHDGRLTKADVGRSIVLPFGVRRVEAMPSATLDDRPDDADCTDKTGMLPGYGRLWAELHAAAFLDHGDSSELEFVPLLF